MLSVIIPSYKDKSLHKTIDSILDNFVNEFEVIPVVDGYEPPAFIKDSRVKPLILKDNVGMREAINAGVRVARGKYIMRSDEHCLFCPGFDAILLSDIAENQIVTARRYFLDPEKWEVMPKHFVDYEKLIIMDNPKKFSASNWKKRSKDRAHIKIDESMALQGSFWLMNKSWWESVIVKLDTKGYGPHYQDTTEMLFKTWAAGGRLMLNKKAWYAHKHRDFNRTHQYPIERAIPEWKFALDTWLPAYEEVRKKWGI